jgi:sporulation protein YqfC
MKKDLWKRTLRLLDLPEDMDATVPRITVVGREQMLVENLSGIRRCSEEEVLLLTGCGVLAVSGEKLLVKELGESRALIVGRLLRWAYGE